MNWQQEPPQIEALLSDRTRLLLQSCPQTGGGVHKWLYITALQLHRYFPNHDDIADLLVKYSANCGRPVEGGELWAAIKDSYRWQEQKQGKSLASIPTDAKELAVTPKWPAPNP